MTHVLATLEWTRPWAFAALVLPLVLLLLALRRPRPRELPTGTVAIWRALAAPTDEGRVRRRARRLPPLALGLALAALCAAALALAGPRSVAAAGPRAFTVLVDVSPSMGLAADGAGGPTRLELALDAARALLAGVTRAGDRVTWSAWDGNGWSAPVDEPPPAWRDAPPRAAGAGGLEPPFAERDRPGVLWVTDGVAIDGSGATDGTPLAPRAAGLVAVGGAEVSGPVGARGTTRIDWDGARLVEVEGALPLRSARLVASDAARAGLRDVVLVLELWADERGFALERAPVGEVADEDADGARVALTLSVAAGPPLVDVELARDGWRASARVAAGGLAADAGRATWLADDAGAVHVGWRAGHVETTLAELALEAGDPAPFAASWAELFDRAQLLPAGIVPLAERRAVRALPSRAPEPAGEHGADEHRPGAGGGAPRWLPTAACAAAAALLATAALLASEADARRSA